MRYRNVGKSGLKISEIGLGSWMTDLSGSAQEDIAKEVVKKAYESGINFFDCADAYAGGAAERFLGKVLADYPREDLVIASKVFFPTGKGITNRGLSRKHIMENCEKSLKNMGVDYLDLYFCHRYDEETPLEETLRALSDLVTQGKILYYGVSEEWSAARIERAQRIIEREHLHPLTVLQPQYNLADRYIEHELMDTCAANGIGITCFSPLAQGLLTGKYKKGEAYPEGSRATHQADRQINNLLTDENLNMVEQLRVIAEELGLNLAVLSLAWILQHREVTSVILGASKISQLDNNLAASGVILPDEVMKRIDEIVGFQKFERHVG